MAKATKKTAKSKEGGSRSGNLPFALRWPRLTDWSGDSRSTPRRWKSACATALKMGADVVLFPELMVTGYPPEDLLLKKSFIKDCQQTLKKIAPCTRGLTAVIGFAEQQGKHLYNSAALMCDGKHVATARKMLLPNYGVFDEKRYFTEGDEPLRFSLKGVQIGLTICEDIWEESGPGKTLSKHIDLLLNISSSPYHKGKGKARRQMIIKRAKSYKCPIAYVNLVGGQDELVFDGESLVVDAKGKIITQGNSFEEEIIFAEVALPPKNGKPSAKGIKSYKTRLSKTNDKKVSTLPPECILGEVGRGRSLFRSGAGYPRLYSQKRILQSGSGFERWHRLIAHGRHSGRGIGRRKRNWCADAISPFLPRQYRRFQSAGEKPGDKKVHLSHCRGHEGLRIHPEKIIQRYRIWSGGREPASPHSWQYIDGTVQQIRLDGADHRQQIGSQCRLLHALWRYGGWIRRDQRRAENPRL